MDLDLRTSRHPMALKSFLGEFEQMVLPAVARRGRDTDGHLVGRELEESAGRAVSQGASDTTFARLEASLARVLGRPRGPTGEPRGRSGPGS